MRKDYLPVDSNVLETIYFGGGTPSLLTSDEINTLICHALSVFPHIDLDKMEITLESNPNDLTDDYLQRLSKTAVNRLSVGVQTFVDEELKVINRRHSAKEAIEAISNAKKHGFNNISLDLIYGLPSQTTGSWLYSVETAISLSPKHISAYCLELHDGSLLTKKLLKGELKVMDENDCLKCFEILHEKTKSAGYEHYEISNFALPNYRSRHNSSYWRDVPYIGVGPAAHSYNRVGRQWNVSHLPKYLKAIGENRLDFECEELSLDERYNDYILTALRTCEGIDYRFIESKFGADMLQYTKEIADQQSLLGNVVVENDMCHLTEKGIFISDSIFTEFIIVEG